MKKRSLKSLPLCKQVVSNLNNKIIGGVDLTGASVCRKCRYSDLRAHTC